jgi:DNA uptake protein ComE-like DNA-binding protein
LKLIKEQRIGVLLLLGAIFILEAFLHFDLFQSKDIVVEKIPLSLTKEISEANRQNHFSKNYTLVNFDPNTYTVNDWQKIGFSPKQSEVILKYKNIVGGKFTSKEQIQKCFVISDEKYAELALYIQLPEKSNEEYSTQLPKTKTYRLHPFNPNDFLVEDWQKIGFSPKQAEVILKYKNIIGGKFTSKEQIQKCFVISNEKYAEIAPFLQIPQQKEPPETIVAKSEQTEKKELNSATFKDLVSVINDASIAGKILSFRKGLGGFVSKEQIKEVYDITPEMVGLILENFTLDVSKVHKINLNTATEEELQKQIYLRRYKQKILSAQKNGTNPENEIPKSDPKYSFIVMYLER